MFWRLPVIYRHDGHFEVVSPISRISLMYEGTHADESSPVDMKNNLFGYLVHHLLEITLQGLNTRLYLLTHLAERVLEDVGLLLLFFELL